CLPAQLLRGLLDCILVARGSGGYAMSELFIKGGPIMWPLLLTSVITVTVVVERLIFMVRERGRRQRKVVERVLAQVERRDVKAAIECGRRSEDFVARTLVRALAQPGGALPPALP